MTDQVKKRGVYVTPLIIDDDAPEVEEEIDSGGIPSSWIWFESAEKAEKFIESIKP